MKRIEGQPLVFRRLWPSERGEVIEHFLRLDPGDRYLRFGGVVRDQPIHEYISSMDWTRSLLVGCIVGSTLRAVGELKVMRQGQQASAEVAVTVEKPFQNRGIGSRLFRRLTTLAANRGIRHLYAICLPQNRRMRSIAMNYDADLTQYESEVEGQIHLPRPSHLSFAEELLDDYLSTIQTALAPLRMLGRL